MLRSRFGWCLVPVLSLALCGPAAPQEPPPEEARQEPEVPRKKAGPRAPQPGDETRVFVLEHALAREIAALLRVFPAAVTHQSTPTRRSDSVQAIAVSAPRAVMAAIAQTIERLDQPRPPARTVELTVYVVEALSSSSAMDVPPSLEPVIAQLRETFRYQGYRVVDSLLTRTSGDSPVTVAGAAPFAAFEAAQEAAQYELRIQRVNVAVKEDGTRSVSLMALAFVAHEPGGPPSHEASVRASVDIAEGQQVVVGKAGLGDSGNALILVLSAKVPD